MTATDALENRDLERRLAVHGDDRLEFHVDPDATGRFDATRVIESFTVEDDDFVSRPEAFPALWERLTREA